jgi:hypothetical protein
MCKGKFNLRSLYPKKRNFLSASAVNNKSPSQPGDEQVLRGNSPSLLRGIFSSIYIDANQVPCAVMAAWFGVMPNPGPSGMAIYPFCIIGFGIPSIRESYHVMVG